MYGEESTFVINPLIHIRQKEKNRSQSCKCKRALRARILYQLFLWTIIIEQFHFKSNAKGLISSFEQISSKIRDIERNCTFHTFWPFPPVFITVLWGSEHKDGFSSTLAAKFPRASTGFWRTGFWAWLSPSFLFTAVVFLAPSTFLTSFFFSIFAVSTGFLSAFFFPGTTLASGFDFEGVPGRCVGFVAEGATCWGPGRFWSFEAVGCCRVAVLGLAAVVIFCLFVAVLVTSVEDTMEKKWKFCLALIAWKLATLPQRI
jgi:hypothetical protein